MPAGAEEETFADSARLEVPDLTEIASPEADAELVKGGVVVEVIATWSDYTDSV